MEWKDKSWDKKNISKYNLAVQISKSYIRLANSDAKSEKVIALAQVPFMWNNEFISDKFLATLKTSGIPISKKYAKVNFCIENDCFCLMPESLVNIENLKDILSINCAIPLNDFVQKDIYKPEQIGIIYSVNEKLKNWIKTHFPSSTLKHTAFYILETFVHKINNSNNSIFIYLQSNILYALVVINHKIHLLNTYYCNNAADILYYTTAIMDALNLPVDNVNLYISGEISKTGETIDTLKNYYPKIYFIENAIQTHLPNTINRFENHFYTLIINQLLCE